MNKQYNVILADAPWPWKAWSDKGMGRSPEKHYSTMTIEDICALPVADLAAPNCALFMWSVWRSMPDAFRVIEAWGFTYKTLAWEWIKLNRSGIGWAIGNGYYTRQNCEPCLLAVRGKMPVAVHDERAYIITEPVELPIVAPRQEHSRKPDIQYEKIERLYPGGRYLELFARRKDRPGWDYWGNEIEPDIALQVPAAA